MAAPSNQNAGGIGKEDSEPLDRFATIDARSFVRSRVMPTVGTVAVLQIARSLTSTTSAEDAVLKAVLATNAMVRVSIFDFFIISLLSLC